MSGLSAFIGWPACAAGLSCPSISTAIYSLAASTMIFSCDIFFPFRSAILNYHVTFPRTPQWLLCNNVQPYWAQRSHRFSALQIKTVIHQFLYSSKACPRFCMSTTVKESHEKVLFFLCREWLCLNLLSLLSLWLLTTKQLCFLINDHCLPSLYCFL